MDCDMCNKQIPPGSEKYDIGDSGRGLFTYCSDCGKQEFPHHGKEKEELK